MVLKDSRFKEFYSGLGSAIISITTTYPATKLTYRQILENATLRESLLKMRKEGLGYLYRGMAPPMIQRCTELSLMFGVYRSAEIALQPLHLRPYQEKLLSSAIAGVAESVFTPFERIQMLLINSQHHKCFRNMAHAAFIIGNQYSFKEYYRGCTIVTIRNIFQNIFFFTSREKLYELIGYHPRKGRKVITNFVVGSIIGICMTTLFYPIKVVKVSIQQPLGGEYLTMSKAIQIVYSRDRGGIRNFYRGLHLNIVRAWFSWGITNLSYESIKNRI